MRWGLACVVLAAAMGGSARRAIGQAVPWSPIAASALQDLAVRAGAEAPSTVLRFASGRVLDLTDVQSASCGVTRVGSRHAARIEATWLTASAGRASAWTATAARVLTSHVVAEVGATRARISGAGWSRSGRPAMRACVAFADDARRAGVWCAAESHGGAPWTDSDGVATGVWWGAADGARCACACRVAPQEKTWSGSCAVDAPVGPGVRLRGAAATEPPSVALGVEVARGRMRVGVERVLASALGDGMRAAWEWTWR